MKKYLLGLLLLSLTFVGADARTLRGGGEESSAANGGPSRDLQILNAPGWHKGARYELGARVVAGPAWNPDTNTYQPGALLRGYQQTNSACMSSSTGRGPSGSGVAISDGTCAWTYLTDVDYVTLSAYFEDAEPWVSGSRYFFHHYVESVDRGVLRIYRACYSGHPACPGTFDKPPYYCTSGNVAPSGTDSGANVWDGGDSGAGCPWGYVATLAYSSRRDFVPHQDWPFGDPSVTGSRAQTYITKNYVANIWYGRAYVAGRNNEMDPIQSIEHIDTWAAGSENKVWCVDHSQHHTGQCGPGGTYLHFKVVPAPGESFRDKPGFERSPFEYCGTAAVAGICDKNSGVTISSTSDHTYGHTGDAFWTRDYGTAFDGIQFKSANAVAFDGNPQGSAFNLTNSILDANGSSAIWGDCGPDVYNNLIINRSNRAGAAGLVIKYSFNSLFNNTVIATNAGPNFTYIEVGSNRNPCGYGGLGAAPIWHDNLFFCTGGSCSDINGVSMNTRYVGSPGTCNYLCATRALNNATDIAAASRHPSFSPPLLPDQVFIGEPMIGVNITGCHSSCSALSPSAVFVDPGSDFRLKPTSPVRGTGEPFSTPDLNGDTISNSVDIRRISRAQSHGYDPGAWQTSP